jgi:asparagine synthetase B (glutamine-hydrolysing)
MFSLTGSVRFGNGAPAPELRRGGEMPLWPQPWRHEGLAIAIDGYLAWPDRLLIGDNDADRALVGDALTGDHVTFLRSIRNGCFNIVVNDFAQRRTHILTDATGFLPLYIFRRPDGCWFSIDLETLGSAVGEPLEHDPTGLAELYRFGYQIGDRTAFRRVSLAPGGTILTFRWEDGAEERRSWVAEPASRAEPIGDPASIPRRVLALITEANACLHHDAVPYGIKLSGGMDSRLIAGCWPWRPFHSYSFGAAGSAEVRLAARLAEALGLAHRFRPIEGDFFTALYPEMFKRFGIVEFFHHALIPLMLGDHCRLALDGLGGDVLLGGLTQKRRGSPRHAVASVVGAAPAPSAVARSDDEAAKRIFDLISVADDGFPVLRAEARRSIAAEHDAIMHDLVAQVRRWGGHKRPFEELYTTVVFNNRTRRYIALQGAACRPQVETLYPFLDRVLQSYAATIPAAVTANKRLYVDIYTQYLPQIRSVPTIMSLLPFSVPTWAHYPARVVRWAREAAGLRLAQSTGGATAQWMMNGMQWARWINYNGDFRDGALRFMSPSAAFDAPAYRQLFSSTRDRAVHVSGSRFMFTASYCGFFR